MRKKPLQELRVAKRADAIKINELDDILFGQHGLPVDYFVQGVDVFGPGLFVLEAGDEIIGYGVAAKDKNITSRGHVLTIAVNPTYHRQGLGEKLATHALDLLARCELDEIWLAVSPENHAAIALYRKLGFGIKKTITNYYGPGEDRLIMIYQLGKTHG